MTPATSRLSLDTADHVAAMVLAEGSRRGLQPMTVVVLEADGHLIVLKHLDGVSNLRPRIALVKGSGGLALEFGRRELAARSHNMPGFFAAARRPVPDGLISVPTGVLVPDAEGRLLGAVGVTADTSAADEARELEAVGLTRETGADG